METPHLPQLGENLGPYRLDEELSRSGMDIVFRGFEPALNRYAAIKVLTPKLAAVPATTIRFQKSARALAKLNHPNCLHIYAADEQNGIGYLAMELVEGTTVATLIQQYSPFDPRETAKLLRQAALGLQHAAQQEITHGHLLPSSLALTNDGILKVTDFRLAAQLAKEIEPEQFAEFFGTPQYLSPEVAAGQQGDERSDIYSLGAIGYHLLTGKPPVTGDTIAAVVEQHKTRTPTPILELCPALPHLLAKLIGQMLALDPINRPQRYEDLIAAFDQFLNPEVTRAPKLSKPVPEKISFAPIPAPAGASLGNRPLHHLPVPSAPPPKRAVSGLAVGLTVSFVLLVAGILFYYKTAPESVRKMSYFRIVLPAPEPPPQPPTLPVTPPKVLTKEEQAEQDFKMVKAAADGMAAQGEWVEAWNLFKQFRSKRYSGTPVQALAVSERQRIQQLVEKAWEDAQKNIDQLATDGKYDEALAICGKFAPTGKELTKLGESCADAAIRTLVAKLNVAADTTDEWKEIANTAKDGDSGEAARSVQWLLDQKSDTAFVKAHQADLQKLYEALTVKPSTKKE